MVTKRPQRVLAAASAAVLLWAGPAHAQALAPGDNSGIDEYSPSLPSGEGARWPGIGRPEFGLESLPPSVLKALPPGSEGRLLIRIATDPHLGAVPSRRDGHDSSTGTDKNAVGSLASSADSWKVAPVLVAMLAVAAGALVLRRRRSG